MRALSIYSFLIATFCMGALWFSAGFLVPKATLWMDEPDAVVRLPAAHVWAATLGGKGWLTATIWASAGLTLCLAGLILSLVNPLWRRLIKARLPFIGVALSTGTLLFLCWHSFSLWFVSVDGAYAQRQETMMYRRVLEKSAMLEEAEGRVNSMKQHYRELLGYEPQPIVDASRLSRTDADLRLSQLIHAMEGTKDPSIAKRLLATTILFTEALSNNKRRADSILALAEKLTGQEFETISEMHDWIAGQSGDEWKPITLYNVEPPGSAK